VKLRDWGAFSLLGLIWGSSFLWIKVAVQELGPFTLVGFRLLFGLLGLVVVVLARRPTFPRDLKTWLALATLGIFNTALPFVLISWGEKSIDSALAAILNGTVPLFTLVIAHWFLHDDRMTLPRVFGLVIGFIGVVVLMSRGGDSPNARGSVLGQAAVLGAALSYAGAAVFARRNLRQIVPVVQAFVPMLVAETAIWAAAAVLEWPLHLPTRPITWLALLWLGLLGSCTAYLLYFYLLHSVGPTRATLVTYVFPVVGLVLGVVFLDELVDWHLAVGAALVAAGIGVVNWKPRRAAAPAAAD